MNARVFLAAMACVAALAAHAPARAQSAVPSAAPSASSWSYEFTPYLWATAMKGDTQIGSLPAVNVDMSFSDILSALDFGAMGAFEARKGRWGFLFDAIYMKISAAGTATRTGPGPVGAALTAGANLTMEQTMLAAAAAYRISDRVTAVDVIGGARYSEIDVTADFHASLFALAGTVSGAGGKNWVDPYVGMRVQRPVTDRWTLVGYADVGGFGVGSDFTWQAAAGVDYRFTRNVSGKFGYRHIAVDYDKDGFRYDMTNTGFYLGAGIRF